MQSEKPKFIRERTTGLRYHLGSKDKKSGFYAYYCDSCYKCIDHCNCPKLWKKAQSHFKKKLMEKLKSDTYFSMTLDSEMVKVRYIKKALEEI